MSKILVILLVKYTVLFVFVFLAFLGIKYFVQSLNKVPSKDKQVLLYLLYGAMVVALGFLIYVGLMAFDYDLLKFTVVFLVSIFLAVWLYVAWLKPYVARYVIIFDNRVDVGDVIEINGEFFRILSFKADKIVVESLEGQTVKRRVMDLLDGRISAVKEKVWFYLDKTDVDLVKVQDLINKNPYIEPQTIALIEEEDLATREQRIKICVKLPVEFEALQKLRMYLNSALEQG